MKASGASNPRAKTAGPHGPAVLLQGPVRAAILRGAWICLAVAGCGNDRGTDPARSSEELPRVRVEPREIALAFDGDPDRVEVSSLAWWGDRLLLIPQQPHAAQPQFGPHWYMLDRAAIAAHLAGDDSTALSPERLPYLDDGILTSIEGWDGIEAVAVRGDRVVVSVEREARGRWGSVLVGGTLHHDPLRVQLDAARIVEIDGDSGRRNFSEEALVTLEDGVLTLHELNGRRVNPRRRAHHFGFDLEPLGAVRMAAVEYRITDATSIDPDGRFWVTNQYWPPEARWVHPVADSLATVRREAGQAVERIVALRRRGERIEFDRSNGVIELELRADGVVRNWEGLVRWDSTGFLVATDRYPRTILAFVPRR